MPKIKFKTVYFLFLRPLQVMATSYHNRLLRVFLDSKAEKEHFFLLMVNRSEDSIKYYKAIEKKVLLW